MISIWRFPIVLALSVVFGMPALQRLMTDPQSLFRAGFQYLGALTLAWFGVNIVFSVMEHYAQHNRRLEEQAEHERLTAELAERRLQERAEQEAREAAEAQQIAEGLVGAADEAGTPSPSPAFSSPVPSAPPVGGSVDLDDTLELGASRQPSTASIAQDLLREEAGTGVI